MSHLTSRFNLFLTLLLLAAGLLTTPVALSGASTLAGIEKSGELVLGTTANMPPMTGKREGKIVGFDIDMARLMATGMGVDLKIKTMAFNELLPALEKGEVDVVISNMTMNPKRNMRVAFVGPYMTSGKCVVTKQEGIAKAEAAENLNSPDIRLAALKGSTSAEFIKVLLPKVTLTLVDDHDSAVSLINEDKTGGLLTDYPICLSMLQRYQDAGFVSLFSLLTYEPIGIALPGNDPLYINWTENFLKRLEGVGVLDELGTRWFGKAVVSTTGE
ncbi:MAG: transporter substrate-binding domain-containing protein [Gammaproteobacteria bacterium]|nr:MAG: transporter substrate-binding domain-containing protein [Gammaproteobacteria bacterium]